MVSKHSHIIQCDSYKKHNNPIFFGLFYIMLLFIPLLSYANYTLNGTTITQTGTDTNLSGLADISGVTTTVLGGVTYYNIGTRRLYFSGTQTISGRTERVITNHSVGSGNAAFRVTGTLTINDFETRNGETTYFEDVVLLSDYNNSFCCNNWGFEVTSTGTLIMNGGRIRSDSSISLRQGSRLEIIQGGFITDHGVSAIQLRFFCDDYDIDGFFIKNYNLIIGTVPLVASTFSGINLFSGNIQASGTLDAGNEVFFIEPQFAGQSATDEDYSLSDRNFLSARNSLSGSDLNIQGSINNARSAGLFRAYKELKAIVEDPLGTAIEDVKIYIRDTDNGQRRDWTASNSEDDNTNIDFTSDRTYFEVTDSSGETSTIDVLLMVVARPTGSVGDAVNTGLNVRDFRGKTGVAGEDKFDVYFHSYNHLLAERELDLSGGQELEITQVLLDDRDITESNSATVAAYTSIDNLDQLYDYAICW